MKISKFKKKFFFLPSLFTCLSVLCGLWSIFISFTTTKYDSAVCLIIIGAIFDAIDGRIARYLNVNSNFGVELDSLADFLTFGVAPIMVYFQAFHWNNDLYAFSFLTIFPVCMALRLAKFNTMALEIVDDNFRHILKKKFFFGLAAPIGAIALMLPIITNFLYYKTFTCQNCALFYALVIALLLVIPVPIFSHKSFHFGFDKIKDTIFTLMTIIFIICFFFRPIKTIFIFSILYFLTIPFSIYAYRKMKNLNKQSSDKNVGLIKQI